MSSLEENTATSDPPSTNNESKKTESTPKVGEESPSTNGEQATPLNPSENQPPVENAPPRTGEEPPPMYTTPSDSHPPGYYYDPPAAATSANTTTYVHTGDGHVIVYEYEPEEQTYALHIAFACVTLWLCGVIFGLIGFILAVIARRQVANGDIAAARSYGYASMVVSIIGFLVGMVLLIVLLAVFIPRRPYYRACYCSNAYGVFAYRDCRFCYYGPY